MVTATFRDYNADAPEAGAFSIDTSYHAGALIAMAFEDVNLSTALPQDVARAMGTFLIRCAGNPSLHGENEFIGQNGYAVRVYATDGEIAVSLNTDSDDDQFAEFELSTEQSVDLGQRLIVWAGVAE